jgi:hypothetical protein
MDVGSVISDKLVVKIDKDGNMYYEFPNAYLFLTIGYIKKLTENFVVQSCKELYDGICEARRRFNHSYMVKNTCTWQVANGMPVILRVVIKVSKYCKSRL